MSIDKQDSQNQAESDISQNEKLVWHSPVMTSLTVNADTNAAPLGSGNIAVG
jgi:hypothetical protein